MHGVIPIKDTLPRPAAVVSNSADSINALGVVRSLSLEGLEVTWLTPDKSRWLYSKHCEPIICPDFTADGNRFVDFLMKLGAKRYTNSRAVLIPTSDDSLIPISKNRRLLEKYYYPLVCEWTDAAKFIDKSKTYQIAESIGVPIPKTYFPESENEVRKIAAEICYPCLLKPTSSHVFGKKFKVKLLKAKNSFELVQAFRFFSTKGFRMMIQEEIPGEDRNLITLNTVLNNQSQPLALFMHRRLIQHPPRFGVVALGESVWDFRIIEPSLKVLRAINFTGIAQVEMKYDSRAKTFKLLEINGRSYLSISFPTACGLNLIYIAFRNAIGERVPPLQDYSCQYECGRKWLNFPSFVKSVTSYWRDGNNSFGELIKPAISSRIIMSTLTKDDPRPIVTKLFSLAAKTHSKV